MIRVEASGTVKAKPEVVFDYLVDGRTLPEWSPKMASSVEQLTPGGVADGTRYRGQFKGMGQVEWMMADVKRPASFVHLATPKMATVKHTWMFAPDAGGTKFTNVIEGKPKGI